MDVFFLMKGAAMSETSAILIGKFNKTALNPEAPLIGLRQLAKRLFGKDTKGLFMGSTCDNCDCFCDCHCECTQQCG